MIVHVCTVCIHTYDVYSAYLYATTAEKTKETRREREIYIEICTYIYIYIQYIYTVYIYIQYIYMIIYAHVCNLFLSLSRPKQSRLPVSRLFRSLVNHLPLKHKVQVMLLHSGRPQRGASAHRSMSMSMAARGSDGGSSNNHSKTQIING